MNKVTLNTSEREEYTESDYSKKSNLLFKCVLSFSVHFKKAFANVFN